jgi:1-acyl-sn-glycerol-3-phosphate acyltransferase
MRVKMSLTGRIVTVGIKLLLHVLCRIRLERVESIPQEGPLIVAVNHINFLEVPLIYTHLYPRPSSSLVKAETWENPILGPLADLWSGIPLQRERTDFSALRTAEERLAHRHLLLIAPEGTRSYNGIMQSGNPGVVILALRTGTPIVPLVHFGGEKFWQNLKRLRRTEVVMRAGRPFFIEPGAGRVNREKRQVIVYEIMHYMASLMPEHYRGHYSADPDHTYSYLKFI